jgi:hypothetical protein
MYNISGKTDTQTDTQPFGSNAVYTGMCEKRCFLFDDTVCQKRTPKAEKGAFCGDKYQRLRADKREKYQAA